MGDSQKVVPQKVVLLPSVTAMIGSTAYTLYEQPVVITIEKPAPIPSVDAEEPGDNITGHMGGVLDNIESEWLILAVAVLVVGLIAVVFVIILKKKKAK